MNKTEVKNFAVSARRDLLEKVALKAKTYGIDEKNTLEVEEKFGQLAVNGEQYSLDKKSAFISLKNQLNDKGYEQLLEEVAYTWFNRIIAIRYMEVHNYLPERINVLSSSTGKVEPDILAEFETIDLDINVSEIKDLYRQGETEQAYRKLFIAQCNALHKILPFMFEQIHDYTELLLPDFLLDSESIINQLVSNEELTNSFEEVEIIGWLYQFYNSEPKDKVFANLKKNKKVEKYDIPAATQLFTPKWIVQYMVENSLGQLWLEANPESQLKQNMEYYIEPAEQEEEVNQKLEEIRYRNINLEEITIIDPCVGSGHILVYAFDLFYEMYEEKGYPTSDIPKLILENNLFGLDIDDRAVQLASFVLMMKAREKSRRIFRQYTSLNILSIQESNNLDLHGISNLLGRDETEKSEVFAALEIFIDAKNYGSIIQPNKINYDKYITRIQGIGNTQLTNETYLAYEQLPEVLELLKQARILSNHYDISITNPPYLSSRSMGKALMKYAKLNYKISNTDLFSIFMHRNYLFTKENGYTSTVNQHSWMFISRYEKIRSFLLENTTILSMLHLGARAFSDIGGEVVQTVAYVTKKAKLEDYRAKYYRLTNINTSESKAEEFKKRNREFLTQQRIFYLIPGNPIAYWAKEQLLKSFKKFPSFKKIGDPKTGMATGDNNKFLRDWFEVSSNTIGLNFGSNEDARKSSKKWFPYNKGGGFRKWYGNEGVLVNWYKGGEPIKKDKLEKLEKGLIEKKNSKCWNEDYYFRESITWSFVSTKSFGVRYSQLGHIFDVGGSSAFPEKTWIKYLLALLNSNIIKELLEYMNPTLNYQSGNIASLPICLDFGKKEQIEALSQNCIDLAKNDWDSFETSWDFDKHPFIKHNNGTNLLSVAFDNWKNHAEANFKQLKRNEEEINQIFNTLYGLQNELTTEVSDEEITIKKADRVRDSKSFISYFIGCVMGRYSIDKSGLTYAGGDWSNAIFDSFLPNKHGLIQLTDTQYFNNDIIIRLREFLEITFGSEKVEENLRWLAESLEIKLNETPEERLRRYFLDEFYKDHCQVYQKHPIYWFVDSGKQKGLRTLIYMHRYQPDTMATIRFEHLQEIQSKYNNEIAAVDLRIVNPNLSAKEKRDLEKRKATYQKRLDELLEFDKKLAEYANEQIEIDLDDGVKVNYAKFDKVLAKIK